MKIFRIGPITVRQKASRTAGTQFEIWIDGESECSSTYEDGDNWSRAEGVAIKGAKFMAGAYVVSRTEGQQILWLRRLPPSHFDTGAEWTPNRTFAQVFRSRDSAEQTCREYWTATWGPNLLDVLVYEPLLDIAAMVKGFLSIYPEARTGEARPLFDDLRLEDRHFAGIVEKLKAKGDDPLALATLSMAEWLRLFPEQDR